MGVLIKNGTIVTAENEFKGDVYVAGKKLLLSAQDWDAGQKMM